jgi:hypothetical protein
MACSEDAVGDSLDILIKALKTDNKEQSYSHEVKSPQRSLLFSSFHLKGPAAHECYKV